MNEPNTIIIETRIIMKDEERESLRCKILAEMNEGVVVLPWYCKMVYPEIKEGKDEQTRRSP